MELLSITISGYRRFRTRTSLQTNGKLIAILGPNEAGKSSLLRAIAHLGNGRALAADEIARDSEPGDVRISGRFQLTGDEIEAARLSGPRAMIVTKYADGRRIFDFDPPAQDRDGSHRAPLAYALRTFAADDADILDNFDDELAPDIENWMTALDDAGETVPNRPCRV